MKSYKGIKIKERSDNRWQARLRIDGQYKYIYGRTQEQCYNALKDFFSQFQKTKFNNDITLNEWAKRWLEIYKKNKVKENTYEQLLFLIEKYVLKYLGKTSLKNLKPLDIETCLNKISDAPRQKVKVFDAFKDCFTKAYKNKLVKENIFEFVDKPKHTKKLGKALDKAEQKKFLKEITGHKLEHLYKVLLFEGIRIGEALALTKNDIDLIHDTISITKTITNNKLGKPKTVSSVRQVPIFNAVKPIFKLLIEQNDNSKYLFDTTYKNAYDAFIKIIETIDLDGFNLHSLRHTFITRCAELGIPSKVIQKWVGHSTNKITEEVYTHVNTDFETKQKLKFDTLFDTLF